MWRLVRKFLAILPVMVLGFIFLWLFDRAFVDSSNHIGFSPWYFLICIPVGIAMTLLFGAQSRKAAVVLTCLIALLLLFAMQFNFLLSYEEFVRKGLPDKPFVLFGGYLALIFS